MASTNPDSMTNAQGEFQPSRPRDEPLTTKGHQPGKQVSEEDAAPEFSAKTLPPGSAPADRTFQPDASSETPGQANNDDTLRSHGKESTYTSAESTLGGTDSGAVHTGLGHPGQGQTSNEADDSAGLEGAGAMGGSGMRGDESAEAKDLQADKTGKGPTTGHNVSRDGAENVEPARSEEL